MKKIKYFISILAFLVTGSGYFEVIANAANVSNATNKFSNEAQNLNSAIDDSKIFNQYLKDASNLANNQKPNQFLKDKSFVQNLAKINDQIFDESLNNQKLRDMFPTVDMDSLKEQVPQLNQLMIFVSSSMAASILKQYATASNKANGVLVLRGLINNSFKQTVSFIRTLDKQGTRTIIDPNAFKLFDVKQVPEIVVIIDNNDCKWGRCDHTPLFDKISGDITLEYGLEEITKRGEFAKKEATRFLNYLRSEGGGNV
jgi:type-F conjugative transfer system pilin assembly protein TrbC